MHPLTFGQLAELYLSQALAGRPSYYEYTRIYRVHFANPAWASQPLSGITRFQIMELNQRCASTPAHGNKIVGFIKQVFAWGQDTINPKTHRPYFEGENPAIRIHRHECNARERLLDYAEIRLLLDTIDFQSPKYQAFFLCRLLVPCRILELCTMPRSAVKLDHRPSQSAPIRKTRVDRSVWHGDRGSCAARYSYVLYVSRAI